MSDDTDDEISDEEFDQMTTTQQFKVERKAAKKHRKRMTEDMDTITNALTGDKLALPAQPGLIDRVHGLEAREKARAKTFWGVVSSLPILSGVITWLFNIWHKGN